MSLFSALGGLFKPEPPPDPQVGPALARIAELADPFIQTAPHFRQALAAPVHHALGYCEGLVASLPGPVDVSRRAFGGDPLVHALFATADDIDRMLGSSQAVRDYLSDISCYESDHFYALLAARRREKRQLGLAREGDVIRTEVPQTVLYFSDHTLVEPHYALERTLASLRATAFDGLLKSFHAHLDCLRREKDGLAADTQAERAHLTVLRGRTGDIENTVATRRLAELDAHLREVAESLMPEHMLEALAGFLKKPEMALRLEPVSVHVDRLGVMTESAERLDFPELIARDQRRHLVLLARIDREEARQAVESTLDKQRRFMVL